MTKKEYTRLVPVSQIEQNEGQLEGLPKNPRYISPDKLDALKRSIEVSPEFLEANPLKVYRIGKTRYVVIAGNMRLMACIELGITEVPCYVFRQDTPIEKLREFAIKDNMAYGKVDWEVIKLDWEPTELEAWDFEVPDWLEEEQELEPFPDEEEKETIEKDEQVESMLNDVCKGIASDITGQYDILNGFSFISPNIAKFDFVNFAYYKKEYPRYDSLAFHPKQFVTKGDTYSTYEGLQRMANGEIKGERLRFVCQDKFRSLISGSLAFGGSKMPLDFPADLARDLINKYANGGSVLDPCCGWGGRLVGFLASGATKYDGTDASPYQCEGNKLIFDTFKDVVKSEKSVNITCSPFEKRKLTKNSFDMALTSPPYFDTEKYIGGEQSHKYGSYELWRDGFYRTLIKKTYEALKTGGFFCLQVGSQRYPLLEDGKQIADGIGFSIVDVIRTDMVNNQAKTEAEAGEVVLILRK